MQPTFPFTTPLSSDNDPEGDALLRERGPVVLAKMGPIDIWLALSYQASRQVLSDSRFSREEATRPGGPVTIPSGANPLVLTSMEGKRHLRVRKLMAQAFSPRMIERLESRVQSIVDSLLDELESPADLVAGLTSPLPIMVICELLGAPYADKDRIQDWSTTLMTYVITPEELRAAEVDIQGYLKELVVQKRAEPDDALISAMVRANDEGDFLREEELLANLQMLLVAGHETTVNQMGNSFVTLFRHPGQLQLLRDDPSLIGSAIDELMRYSRLFAATLPRVTTEAVVLDGVEIGAGEPVIPILSAGNRDPEVFTDPDRFDITRQPPSPHLSFAHGPHFCLGTQLAKMELRVAISTVLKRFPGLRLAIADEELAYKTQLSVRALERLPVEF